MKIEQALEQILNKACVAGRMRADQRKDMEWIIKRILGSKGIHYHIKVGQF